MWSFAFVYAHGGQWSVSFRVGGQDDWVGHGPGAVWNVDACVAVIVILGGERTARRDVRDRQGMCEARDIFKPVFPQSPAADAVSLKRCVVLFALCTLPGILRDKAAEKSGVASFKCSWRISKILKTQTCVESSVSVSSLRHCKSSSCSSCI